MWKNLKVKFQGSDLGQWWPHWWSTHHGNVSCREKTQRGTTDGIWWLLPRSDSRQTQPIFDALRKCYNSIHAIQSLWPLTERLPENNASIFEKDIKKWTCKYLLHWNQKSRFSNGNLPNLNERKFSCMVKDSVKRREYQIEQIIHSSFATFDQQASKWQVETYAHQ